MYQLIVKNVIKRFYLLQAIKGNRLSAWIANLWRPKDEEVKMPRLRSFASEIYRRRMVHRLHKARTRRERNHCLNCLNVWAIGQDKKRNEAD